VTEHERLNYLNDHISYEVIMLNYTFMRLMTFKASTAEDELERNAFPRPGVRSPRHAAFVTGPTVEDARSHSAGCVASDSNPSHQ
jgi:hypothetical protein